VKYLVFGFATLAGVPLMAFLAASSRSLRGWLLAALVFSPVLGDMANINFLSMESYRGPDRGFEVSLSDLLALGLVLSLLLKDAGRVRWLPFNSLPIAVFIGYGVLTTLASPVALYGSFTVFKLLKFYLIYWAVMNTLWTGTSRDYVWWGLVATAFLMTTLALQQKYLLGIYRVHTLFDHSNTIPAFANLILPALLIWGMVDRKLSLGRAILSGLGALGLSFTVVATYSRAGLVLTVVCVLGALFLAVRRASPTRALMVTSVVLVMISIGGMIAADSVIDRFLNAPESSEKARDEFNTVARHMAKDHLLGIGLNNFSHVLTETGRYRNHLTVMENEEQAGVVHHIYYLTAAEMGYLGLALFLFVMARFTWITGWHGIRGRGPERAIVGGFFLGLCALHLTGLLEWVFRLTPVLYQFAIVCGCAVALIGRNGGDAETGSGGIVLVFPTTGGVTA
jgi:hypothetical protein